MTAKSTQNVKSMDRSYAAHEWLEWLTRVRLLMIALILSVGVAWPSYLPLAGSSRYFLPLVIFWITLATLHIILVRWLPKARWHGPTQVASDVLMISALVYATGLQESYFISLYLLVIIVASILFSRNAAFITAAVCVVLLGVLTFLAYEGKIPRTYVGSPTTELLRLWFLSNLIGFLAVSYLAGLLAQSLRSKGVELEEKREELMDLQDFTEDIIHSMRGGLLTTDVEGRITLLNRTGEEILGRRYMDVRGQRLQDWNEEFWLPGRADGLEKTGQRREVEVQTPDGQHRYIGISVSP